MLRIGQTTKTKGPKPKNINMEVDVDATTWSTTKIESPKLNHINKTWSTIKIKGLELKTL